MCPRERATNVTISIRRSIIDIQTKQATRSTIVIVTANNSRKANLNPLKLFLKGNCYAPPQTPPIEEYKKASHQGYHQHKTEQNRQTDKTSHKKHHCHSYRQQEPNHLQLAIGHRNNQLLQNHQ